MTHEDACRISLRCFPSIRGRGRDDQPWAIRQAIGGVPCHRTEAIDAASCWVMTCSPARTSTTVNDGSRTNSSSLRVALESTCSPSHVFPTTSTLCFAQDPTLSQLGMIPRWREDGGRSALSEKSRVKLRGTSHRFLPSLQNGISIPSGTIRSS